MVEWGEKVSHPSGLGGPLWARIRGALVLGVVGVAAAVLIAELVLRQFPGWVPEAVRLSSPVFVRRAESGKRYFAESEQFQVPDTDLGLRLRPEVDVFFRVPRPYESFPVRTVRLPGTDIGVRRSGPVPARPFALAVGDSLVFGWGVRGEDAWVDLLERRTGFAFVNMGVGGSSSLQATRLLERYGPGLRPKIVLWGFSHNDFEDNVQFAAWRRAATAEPYERWRRSPEALSGGKDRPLAGVRDWLRGHLVLVEVARLATQSLRGEVVEYRDGGLDFLFYASERRAAPTELALQGADFTRQALRQASEVAVKMGATLVVAIFPAREQVYWPLVRRLFSVGQQDDPDWRTNLIAQFCRENSIRYIDLTPTLKEAGTRDLQVYFRADRWHLTPLGNRLVADTVLNYLRTERLVPHEAPR